MVKENYFGHKVWLKAGTTTHLGCRTAASQEDCQALKIVACHNEEKHVFLHGLSLVRQLVLYFLHIDELDITDLENTGTALTQSPYMPIDLDKRT